MAMAKRSVVEPQPQSVTADAATTEVMRVEGVVLGGLMHDAAQLAAAVTMTQGLKLDATMQAFDQILDALVKRRQSWQ